MGNTSELKCHLKRHLYLITTDISFSILVLALANAIYCFIAVVVVVIGKSGDCIVFRNSNIEMKRAESTGNPRHMPLPNDNNGKCMPFVIVGDEAFDMSEYVIYSFLGNSPASEI